MGYSHGKKWTEEEIIIKIKEMVENLGMDTMPTHSELNNYFGSSSLSGAISKRGGSARFAKILGLEIKNCETKFGEKLEDYCVLQIQEKLKLQCEKTNSRFPYDILVNRAVKVDVKASRLFENYGKSKYYTFNLEKKEQTCDVFVFYCINEKNEIEKTLIIPAYILSGKKQFSLGFKSMYDKYENKWEYIKHYYDFIIKCI